MVAHSAPPRRSFVALVLTTLAAVSKQYILTVVRQTRAFASFTWRIMKRFASLIRRLYQFFESALVGLITDTILFVWAVRSFLLLLAIEGAFIVLGYRWPLLWIVAAVFGLLLLTAAIETARSLKNIGKDADPLYTDRTRGFLFKVVLWSLRVVILFMSLAVSGTVAREYGLLDKFQKKEPVAATDTATTEAPTPPPSAQRVSLSIANQCNKKIFVAICYRNPEDMWISGGWWGVEPGTTKEDIITDAIGPEVYFYAESGGMRWVGDERHELKRMAPIRDPESFTIPADAPNTGEYKQVSFFGSRIELGAARYTEELSCN